DAVPIGRACSPWPGRTLPSRPLSPGWLRLDDRRGRWWRGPIAVSFKRHRRLPALGRLLAKENRSAAAGGC
ncbi:hypothetical protein ACVSMD_19330, partial [Pseudomonas aeruginosa]